MLSPYSLFLGIFYIKTFVTCDLEWRLDMVYIHYSRVKETCLNLCLLHNNVYLYESYIQIAYMDEDNDLPD